MTTGAPRADAVRTFHRPRLDFAASLGALRFGASNPTQRVHDERFAKAFRTPDGPATLVLTRAGGDVVAEAYGPGAEWALEAVPRLLGDDDGPEDFVPTDERVHALVRRFRGLRLPRAPWLDDVLLEKVLEQRVTWREAAQSFADITRAFAEPAPGPLGLLLAIPLSALSSRAPVSLSRYGVDHQRSATLRRLGDVAHHVERVRLAPLADVDALLAKVPGVGPWTRASVLGLGCGDPDAVPIGDAHLPNLVAWYLAGELGGTDERMLALLAPFAGHRHRVLRLFFAAGLTAPRFRPAPPPQRRR